MFKDWKEKVILLNDAIAASKANVKWFSNQEFLVAFFSGWEESVFKG